jgi:hypothetical protein
LGSACKNRQFYGPLQRHSIDRTLEGSMTLKLYNNKEFSACFRDWTGVIQHRRASVERAVSENNISTDEQETCDGDTYPTPKGRVASDRHVT